MKGTFFRFFVENSGLKFRRVRSTVVRVVNIVPTDDCLQFMNAHVCVEHDSRDVAPRAGPSAADKTCSLKAKFHYTGPTGTTRTLADFFARPGPQTRVSDRVRGLCLVGSGRARVVEFSYK